jgi:hypothetical protein
MISVVSPQKFPGSQTYRPPQEFGNLLAEATPLPVSTHDGEAAVAQQSCASIRVPKQSLGTRKQPTSVKCSSQRRVAGAGPAPGRRADGSPKGAQHGSLGRSPRYRVHHEPSPEGARQTSLQDFCPAPSGLVDLIAPNPGLRPRLPCCAPSGLSNLFYSVFSVPCRPPCKIFPYE